MTTMDQDIQESVSTESPSILQQAIALQATDMLGFAMQYKAIRDRADNIVSDAKQAVKEAVTNYVVDSINSQNDSNATKLAHTAQGAVLLAAAELLPESVPGAMAMAMPVKGLGGAVQAGDLPIAGAMFSAAENLGETLPSATVNELAVYDTEEFRLLMLKAQKPQLLAEAESKLNAAVDTADIQGMAQAANQYSNVAKIAAPDLTDIAGAGQFARAASPNLQYAQKVEALVEQRLQLAIAIEKGDFQGIKSSAHQFQDNLAQVYEHRALSTPGAKEFEQASLIANRVEEAVKQLDKVTDQQAALQQLINLTVERDALEKSMTNTLRQPTSLASRVLMDSAKTLAEEAIEQRTATALPGMQL